jgi:hypothetical protein
MVRIGTMKRFTFKCFPAPDGPPVWIGSCSELRITTEADTYEALQERCWKIGPEMAVENGLADNESEVILDFISSEDFVAAAE